MSQSIEGALKLLKKHFGSSTVKVGAPAKKRDIDALERDIGALPPGLREMLGMFDGLSIKDIDHRIMTCAEIRKAVLGDGRVRQGINPFTKELVTLGALEPNEQRIPVGDRETGDHDWVIRGVPVGAGSVVYVDHEMDDDGGLTFMASDLATYLNLWALHLTARYDRNRGIRIEAISDAGPGAYPFDEAWILSNDRAAKALLEDEAYRRVLAAMERI